MYFDVANHFNFSLVVSLTIAIGIKDVKEFSLPDSFIVPLAPAIGREISRYLWSATQEIYINSLPFNDIFVTNQPSGLLIRRVLTAQNQYISSIGHQLAAKLQFTPLEICQNLHSQFRLVNIRPGDCLEIDSWYTEAGYLYFQLTPYAVLQWLNYVQDLSIERTRDFHDSTPSPSSASLALYAHARCCSLLKLAQTEKLISFNDRWQITTPDWLICDSNHREKNSQTDRMLFFELPVEHQLIHALMDVLEGIYGDRHQNWAKLALNLAQNWLEFDRYCQVFGDTKRQNPRLAIARCGLTAISRRYLQVLLENYLGMTAPMEF